LLLAAGNQADICSLLVTAVLVKRWARRCAWLQNWDRCSSNAKIFLLAHQRATEMRKSALSLLVLSLISFEQRDCRTAFHDESTSARPFSPGLKPKDHTSKACNSSLEREQQTDQEISTDDQK